MGLVMAAVDSIEDASREIGVPVPEDILITRRALNAIHWDLTGLNTALLTTGGIDTLAAFGFNDAVENATVLNIGLETRQAQAEIAQLREPLPAEGLDLSLFLVPVAGIVAFDPGVCPVGAPSRWSCGGWWCWRGWRLWGDGVFLHGG
ncbi:hypothetical protein HC928_23155 [bacterium]|nr:hypothetical protein [bacterium]